MVEPSKPWSSKTSLATSNDRSTNFKRHRRPFKLLQNEYWTSGCTSVEKKFYPRELLPWSDFEADILPAHFRAITDICGGILAFVTEQAVAHNGSSIARSPAGNENSIVSFEQLSLETPVTNIIEFAASREEFRQAYDTKCVSFSSNHQELKDLSVAASQPRPSKRSKLEGTSEQVRSTTKPDGFGRQTLTNGAHRLAFVFDYKAAHRVDVKYVREAVAKTNLFDEVVQRIHSAWTTTDDDVRHREDAESSIATSLVQVYDYMVTFGVAYGYVAAGYTLLLMYAVAQVLCLCLEAFKSESDAKTWPSSGEFAQRWPNPYTVEHLEGCESSKSDSSTQTTDGSKD